MTRYVDLSGTLENGLWSYRVLPGLEPLVPPVSIETLAGHAPKGGIAPGEALLVQTGWGRQWNREGYVLRCPTFARRAVEWVVEQRIGIFGVDVPCIESAWSEDAAEEKGGLLGLLFRRGILLVAPLVNLERVKADRGVLFCLPLPVAGTSGAPARVVFATES